MIDLTIIIPTRNRLPSLARLFASLSLSLSRIETSFEIFVVNNGDIQNTAKILELAIAANLEIVVLGPTPGKSWGLNEGLKRAKGKIICPLDDDVVVASDWAERLLGAHRSTGFDAIQGKILPGVDPEGRPADPTRLREYNIPMIDYGEEVREIRGLTGTNGSFKREVFERVGYYDTRLGPGGSGFSEDTEYSTRIRREGFKIGYTPHAIVYHELNPARYGLAVKRDAQYRKGLSRSVYRHDSIVFDVLPNLFANCVRLVIYKALGARQKSYKTEGRILKYWGYLVGKVRLFKLFGAR
ncbi:MAG: glycosyltransferase family 2 protein [Deltaproteobacteria bacterium]|nr:glycosyltransferase family 2 protein [Deltaproteobacteria bacterium]